MRTLERDKKPLYVCKRIPDSEPVTFEKPVERRLNTVSTTSNADLVAFGDQYKMYRRATVPLNQMDRYHEGDRVYIYNMPPKEHDPLCEGCDFEITSVSDGISNAVILFKRLQIGKETENIVIQ